MRGVSLSGRVVSEQEKEEQEEVEVDTSPGFFLSPPPLSFFFFFLRICAAFQHGAQPLRSRTRCAPSLRSARSAHRNIHDATVRSTCTSA